MGLYWPTRYFTHDYFAEDYWPGIEAPVISPPPPPPPSIALPIDTPMQGGSGGKWAAMQAAAALAARKERDAADMVEITRQFLSVVHGKDRRLH